MEPSRPHYPVCITSPLIPQDPEEPVRYGNLDHESIGDGINWLWCASCGFQMEALPSPSERSVD